MDSRIADLLDLIDETARLLRTYGEAHWAAWLERNGRFIHNQDFHGIEQLLGGYGGIGSFNEVAIDPLSGHPIPADAVAEVNERFQDLKGKLYALASELRREELA